MHVHWWLLNAESKMSTYVWQAFDIPILLGGKRKSVVQKLWDEMKMVSIGMPLDPDVHVPCDVIQ